MTETALDEFAGALRARAQHSYLSGDGIVRSMWPYIPAGWREDILQDPRYIQHCEEQDRKAGRDYIAGVYGPDVADRMTHRIPQYGSGLTAAAITEQRARNLERSMTGDSGTAD